MKERATSAVPIRRGVGERPSIGNSPRLARTFRVAGVPSGSTCLAGLRTPAAEGFRRSKATDLNDCSVRYLIFGNRGLDRQVI